ncbi:hypothetical protein JVU11DRAFT_4692 [Chiua virens]|nr:hypothetical protein JVU11DRAFT_4692 [Chiua virens]
MTYTPSSDFYTLLRIPRDSLSNDVKRAYHRTLLRLHPDKQRGRPCQHPATHGSHDVQAVLDPSRLPTPDTEASSVDMALLKEAYRTLSDANLRTAYDRALRREEQKECAGPRPAQVVSLEEFSLIATEDAEAQAWRYECRCGGMYHITEGDLENGMHLVGCESCSEVIWVGYEEAVTEDEDGEGV